MQLPCLKRAVLTKNGNYKLNCKLWNEGKGNQMAATEGKTGQMDTIVCAVSASASAIGQLSLSGSRENSAALWHILVTVVISRLSKKWTVLVNCNPGINGDVSREVVYHSWTKSVKICYLTGTKSTWFLISSFVHRAGNSLHYPHDNLSFKTFNSAWTALNKV